MTEFPVREVLPELLAALRDGSRALLVAPPGAGKTTQVAPALLDEPWVQAARSCCSFRAASPPAPPPSSSPRRHGEQPGATFGYATRLDSKVGKATRVIAMTHGVFLARIQADPELEGRLRGAVRRGPRAQPRQ